MDLSALALLLSITIDIDPDIGKIFGLTITWHGLFTAIGIICGVSLSVYLARVDGVPSDVGQEIALVSVISAIIGARLFFVFEHWDRFENDLAAIVIIAIFYTGDLAVPALLVGGTAPAAGGSGGRGA